MFIYIIAGILLAFSLMMVLFAFRSDDIAVRVFASFISAIPWIILFVFLYSYKK